MVVAEDFIDSTLANLKIIGMVAKNGKVCVRKGQLTIESDDHLQPLRRWYNRDSRDVTLIHIRNTVGNAIKVCKAADAHAELQWAKKRLVDELHAALEGIENLKTTYRSDAMMVAHLEVMADRLRSTLATSGDHEPPTPGTP